MIDTEHQCFGDGSGMNHQCTCELGVDHTSSQHLALMEDAHPEVPTHVNIGAQGFALRSVLFVDDYTLKMHKRHEAGWATYGISELDCWVCARCKTVWVEGL